MAAPARKKITLATKTGVVDGLAQMKKAVQALQTKSQSKIQQINALAESQYDMAPHVVKILVDELRGAPFTRVQPLIMVVDCILKRVGKVYKTQFGAVMYNLMSDAVSKSDEGTRRFLQKMLTDSWRKHDLLTADVLNQVERIFATAGPAPVYTASVKAEEDAAARAAAAPGTLPAVPSTPGSATAMKQESEMPGTPAGQPAKAPPMKAPPTAPSKSLKVTTSEVALDTDIVKRRLGILTKIIERQSPSTDELHEIMKVPEVRAAVTMQHKGQRQEAMSVLSKFKADLELKFKEQQAKEAALGLAAPPTPATDPRQGLADPRRQDLRPTDPRQAEKAKAKAPADPRQSKPVDPRRLGTKVEPNSGLTQVKRQPDTIQDPRPKQRRTGMVTTTGRSAPVITLDDPDEMTPEQLAKEADAAKRKEKEKADKDLAEERQMLRGAANIGFSESWLRKFMEQLPTKGGASASAAAIAAAASAKGKQAPVVGRRVLAASGEQMVYVDEIAPSEVLLLMQFVFMLEDKLRRNGPGHDIMQRIPHTFSQLETEAGPLIDVMLKRFFDELPFQCSTTGLRFSSREKMRKHHDSIHRRKVHMQARRGGTDARGWMETIPEWVGNRDLVVGPALFRLGGEIGVDEPISRADMPPDADSDNESELDPRERWQCPFDERRAVCPVSGETFERTWSSRLNSWVFEDVVAVEPGVEEPLKFLKPEPGWARRKKKGVYSLTESTVLFKRAIFNNTPPSARFTALEECQRTLANANQSEEHPPKPVQKPWDQELLSFATFAKRRRDEEKKSF